MSIGKSVEDIFLEVKKDSAVAVMQEYFPNGGIDYDNISELYEAIISGKVPGLGPSY